VFNGGDGTWFHYPFRIILNASGTAAGAVNDR
jgi:hypothetical protein